MFLTAAECALLKKASDHTYILPASDAEGSVAFDAEQQLLRHGLIKKGVLDAAIRQRQIDAIATAYEEDRAGFLSAVQAVMELPISQVIYTITDKGKAALANPDRPLSPTVHKRRPLCLHVEERCGGHTPPLEDPEEQGQQAAPAGWQAKLAQTLSDLYQMIKKVTTSRQTVQWTKAYSADYWASIFGVGRNEMNKLLKDGTIQNRKLAWIPIA